MRLSLRLAALPAAVAAGYLAACAPSRPPVRDDIAPPDSGLVPLRAIHLVHGDGEYAWHDSAGARHHADRDALREAREAAAKAAGESFVFHLEARAPLFGRRSDGFWFHYRDGILIGRGTYAAYPGDSALAAEARVLRARGGMRPAERVVLAWFSHEIEGTEALSRRALFDGPSLAGGLSRLQPRADSSKPYALVVVSSCYGGNPETLRALAPLAERVVASPAYLHLSYLDVSAFGEPWAAHSAADAAARLADTVAARSFARLSRLTRTEVTVATYDTERIVPFLPAEKTTSPRTGTVAWTDCAGRKDFDPESAAQGVKLLYRPPEFGANKGREARSAWQCRAFAATRATDD